MPWVQTRATAQLLADWRPRVLEDGRPLGEPFENWLVGAPGMSTLVRPLTRNVDLQSGVAVHELARVVYVVEEVGFLGHFGATASRFLLPFDRLQAIALINL